jgi:hypothetical protein
MSVTIDDQFLVWAGMSEAGMWGKYHQIVIRPKIKT